MSHLEPFYEVKKYSFVICVMHRQCIIISYSAYKDNPFAGKDPLNQAISIGKWRACFNHDNIATAVYYSSGFTGKYFSCNLCHVHV